MERESAIRVLSLYVPIALVAMVWAVRSPERERAVSALIATLWCVPSLLLVNVLAQRAGWWQFAPGTGAIMGMPADLLIGWAVLWGAVPILLLPSAGLVVVVPLLAALDLVLMPLCAPVVQLGENWLVGEAVAIALVLVPAQLYPRLNVGRRALMQATTFAGLMFGALPSLVFTYTGSDWGHLLETWNAFGGLHVQLALIPGLMGLSAVQEFVQRGGGTPIPYDAPQRLVTSGPYAYVANPMQLSMSMALTAWGLIIGEPWFALAGPMAFVYSVGVAAWDESSDLTTRFGESWEEYRRNVRPWVPRLRPYHGAAAARLYVAETCGPCSEVAAWFARRSPTGLMIVPAELHPSRDLSRVTYEPGDGGPDEEGVAAIARALEHVHLGWAALGWMLRLPGIRAALQLIVDASGGEPRLVPRRSQAEVACARR